MRISSDELSKGSLLLIAGKSFEKYTTDERNIIIRHIQAGHRLLAFVDGDSVPFFDSLHEILQHAGIYVCPTKVRSNEDNHYIVTRNINKSHAITMGVNEISLRNAIKFILSQSKTSPIDILVRSENNHNPPNAVLACATKLGNGKIVAVSSWEILKEDFLGESDNALFIASAVYWLLDMRPPPYLLERINTIVKS